MSSWCSLPTTSICSSGSSSSDASVQEQDAKRRGDWEPPREPVARGPARSVGIARGESRLLPTRCAAHGIAGCKRQLRHPRESGDPLALAQTTLGSRLRGNDDFELARVSPRMTTTTAPERRLARWWGSDLAY